VKPSLVAPSVALLLAGCVVGPDFHRPAAPSDTSYTPEAATQTASADGRAQRFVEGQSIAADWWRMLGCPALDDAVAQALRANPGLDAARATLRQNQDLLRAGYGVFFPQMSAAGGASWEHYNPAPGAIPLQNTFNLFSLSGTVSYAVDIWGGKQRQVEALRAGVDSQKYALASATMMLASNVVDAIVAQAAYRAEIEATKATLALLHEQVGIAQAEATAGTAPYSTVLSLQSQVASTEATLPAFEEKIDQAGDLLAALSGLTPAHRVPPAFQLADLHLPEDVPLSVPSQLVRQRPDVLISEEQLRAANASIGVATAAMLPNLTLSAGFGVNNTSLVDLFSSNSPFWSLGAGITQPIFQGGTLYYQRRAAIDARDVAAANYRQTVLAAFQQVADTLRGLSHDADALNAQIEAVDAAERALRLLQANYQAGIATYLQVLTADTQYLQAKTAYVQAVAQRLQDTVALYVALGGGWWNASDAGQPKGGGS
jgi:NodT family efflux transporter outer membrane factor (OMF) lipoprotein